MASILSFMGKIERMLNIVSTNRKLYSSDPTPINTRTVTSENETFYTDLTLHMDAHVILIMNMRKSSFMALCCPCEECKTSIGIGLLEHIDRDNHIGRINEVIQTMWEAYGTEEGGINGAWSQITAIEGT